MNDRRLHGTPRTDRDIIETISVDISNAGSRVPRLHPAGRR